MVLIATVVGVAVTARLGVWQLSRASQKEALQTSLERQAALPPLSGAELADSPEQAATQHFRRVTLQGEWLASATVYLENRQMRGQPGFFVVTPLRLSDQTGTVLVQRGWIPRDASDRTRLKAVHTPEGRVALQGRIAPPPSRLYELGPASAESGAIRQNLDVSLFSRELRAPLKPLSVLQDDNGASTAVPNDGLVRDWPVPAVGVHKHYGYAFQWFALCALLTGLYVWFQLLSPSRLRSRHAL